MDNLPHRTPPPFPSDERDADAESSLKSGKQEIHPLGDDGFRTRENRILLEGDPEYEYVLDEP
jgi:hypothetical protein